MNSTFICVGVSPCFDITLLLDSLAPDTVSRVGGELREAAGVAVNVARELKRLGKRSVVTGLLNEDGSEEYCSALKASRIENDFVFIPGRVRINITLLVGKDTYKVNRRSVCPTDAAGRLRMKLLDWAGKNSIVVFGGATPEGMSPEQYAQLMNAASSAGARVAVDTDVLTREQLLEIKPWLYKPNAAELSALCGLDNPTDSQLVEAARQLTGEGVGIVLLTFGSRGLVAVTAEETAHVAAVPVECRNSVGAGDCALAGFMAAFDNGLSLQECAQAAAESGAAAAAGAGTGPESFGL